MDDRKISDLLEKSLQWMDETGGSPEEAASQFPQHEKDLLDMLRTAEKLEAISHPAPRTAFKAVARTRLINQIQARETKTDEQSVTKARPLRQILQNHNLTRRLSMTWIIIIGLLAATFAGGGSVALASTDALPGDALYPVKTSLQDLALVFSSDENDIDLLMENMGENLEELNQLATQSRFGDMNTGLDEYEENLKALIQTRTRLAYEDAGTEESLNSRIQSQLQLHSETLEQLKLQTKEQLRIQDKLQEAIQLTETGKVYGPSEGGPNQEQGTPNGAGPGESQQSGKPEDNGSGQGEQGNPDAGSGPGGKQEGPGTGDGQAQCTCQEEGLYCVMGEVQDEDGQTLTDATCTCQEGDVEAEQYCYQYQYQYEGEGSQHGSGSGDENGDQTGKP